MERRCITQYPKNLTICSHSAVWKKSELRGLILKTKTVIKSFGYESATLYWSHHANGFMQTDITLDTDAIIESSEIWESS